ncbi:MAG: sodium:proton antiporter [Phycisphaerales bacterium]|nr:sodium:proton antiporter [Phycisphaerales bacterium]
MPVIPLWLVIPFTALLLSVALMPFISSRFWHDHFPDFSFFGGALVTTYYLLALGQPGYKDGHSFGGYWFLHTGIEYIAFIALVGGLYVASGGIRVELSGKPTPLFNTALLAIGAVLANVIGTTGASVLLIRPFIRQNTTRLRPLHIVFFIFIVSNCGGCLTPIGDPPLFLGFIKGVPFFWTLANLWKPWMLAVGLLLAMFYIYDRRCGAIPSAEASRPEPQDRLRVRIHGTVGIISLLLIIAAVFIDPLITRATGKPPAFPIGAAVQIVLALLAYFLTPNAVHNANGFSLFPIKEVGMLFIGIFLTMMPALAYLSKHAPGWGVDSPTAYYFLTGSLSAGLDNAPTYLSFLQIAFGDTPIDAGSARQFLSTPDGIYILKAISMGAVFFGAMTYIGNGPNFMVKSIAEGMGVRMPSFFGYFGSALLLLGPVLVAVWLVFLR